MYAYIRWLLDLRNSSVRLLLPDTQTNRSSHGTSRNICTSLIHIFQVLVELYKIIRTHVDMWTSAYEYIYPTALAAASRTRYFRWSRSTTRSLRCRLSEAVILPSSPSFFFFFGLQGVHAYMSTSTSTHHGLQPNEFVHDLNLVDENEDPTLSVGVNSSRKRLKEIWRLDILGLRSEDLSVGCMHFDETFLTFTLP